MSFTIKHGLFKASITDYHAILGVSLDADPKKIRLKYLRIAQKLHPDTCKASPEGKKLAGKILSRLVNPAYEQLSSKNGFAEHQLVLTQVGKRYAEKSDHIGFASEPAQNLLNTKSDFKLLYENTLKELTADHYQDISQVLKHIAVISEVNFAYLLLNQKQGINREERVIRKGITAKNPAQAPKAQEAPAASKAQDDTELKKTRVNSYLRRAKEYMAKNSLNETISELRDALKLDPNNGIAHALMGQAYMKQNQLTMAKVHIQKAYAAEPKDPTVLTSKEQLEKLTQRKERRANQASSTKGKKEKSNNSGFFGGLFGSKKK